MITTLLWTVFAVLLALVVLAAVVRAVKGFAQRQSGEGEHRHFHDH